ncbi:hypothetical protein SESBI_12369 [Sesbania bispinosa]|nr:hypothetical protein SESBI_12369 [Sesbania bispinosa]
MKLFKVCDVPDLNKLTNADTVLDSTPLTFYSNDSVLLPPELFVKSPSPAPAPELHSIHNLSQFASTFVLLGVRSTTAWLSSYSDCVPHPQLSNHHQVLDEIPHGKHIHHILQLLN